MKSHEVWEVNKQLKEQAAGLELAIQERTADLVKQQVAAEEANKAKTVFLASMSHAQDTAKRRLGHGGGIVGYAITR